MTFIDVGRYKVNPKNIMTLHKNTDNNIPFETYYEIRANVSIVLLSTDNETYRDEVYNKLLKMTED